MDTPATPPKKTTKLGKSNQSTNAKSTLTSPDRNTAKFSNIKEIPLDPQSRYTISYVPGMVEHEIDTGKTFEDAKMKIVLLTSELERVNTYNYSLVRENEVLRVQSNKSEREKDLENKLAIVLAENEKLNQVIEDIYDVYMSSRGYGSGSNEEYEKRISDLYHDLEEWKQRYNILENQSNAVELENTIQLLQNEKDLLSEQLTRKDRDLEMLRARLTPVDKESANVNELAQNNAELIAENKSLQKEIEALKLKHGKARDLQVKIADYENKIKSVLAENERLNGLLVDKTDEAKDLKNKLEAAQKNNKNNNLKDSKVQEVTISLAQKEEQAKKSGTQTPKVKELTEENAKIQQEIDILKAQLLKNKEVQTQLAKTQEENSRLKQEIDKLMNSTPKKNDNKELQAKLNKALEENLRLQQEIERLKTQAAKNKETQANLTKALEENARLKQDIDKLMNLTPKKNDNKELQAQLNKVLDENKRLIARINENERELSILTEATIKAKENQAAIERLTFKISELIQENEKLKASNLKKSNASINGSIDKERIKKLEEIITERQKEIEDFYVRFGEVNQKALLADENKEKLNLAIQENERLTNLLSDKYDEIIRLNAKISNLESQNLYPKSNEDKLQILLSENQRLTDLLKEKSNQVDNLKYSQTFAPPTQDRDVLNKLTLITTENERLNKELDAMRTKLSDLGTEKFRLELNISDKDREIESLKSNNNLRVVDSGDIWEIRGQNESLKSAGAEQTRKIGELEGRLAQLTQLETKVNYYNLQIEQLHKDVLSRENDISNLTQKLADKDKEIDDLKRKALYGDYDQERKIAAITEEKENQIRKLQQEKILAEQERDGLLSLLRNLQSEIEDWKKKYVQLEGSANNKEELNDLKRQFENLQNMSIQIKDLQQKFAAERTAYETQILQLDQTISGLQEEKEILANEKERLANLSTQRLSQIHQLEYKSNEDGHKLEIYQLKNQIEHLKSISIDAKQLAIQHATERAGDLAKINELTNMNYTLKSDMEQLKNLMDQRKADVESLTQQNEDLAKICQKLQSERTGASIGGNPEDVEVLKTQISALELSRNEYKRQAESHSIDISRKNRELVEKIQEVEVLKLKYEEALANYQALNNQLFNKLSAR